MLYPIFWSIRLFPPDLIDRSFNSLLASSQITGSIIAGILFSCIIHSLGGFWITFFVSKSLCCLLNITVPLYFSFLIIRLMVVSANSVAFLVKYPSSVNFFLIPLHPKPDIYSSNIRLTTFASSSFIVNSPSFWSYPHNLPLVMMDDPVCCLRLFELLIFLDSSLLYSSASIALIPVMRESSDS